MSRLMVGVSGVRGIVGEALTAEVAEQFGRAFATMLPVGATIALGRDTRPSGAMIRDAVVAGLSAGGINVIDLGVVSTPGVALMIKHLSAEGGIVITASHNPAPYNGIKFMTPSGQNLPDDQARRLKDIQRSGKFSSAQTPGTTTQNDRTHDIHVRSVCDIVDVETVSSRKFKVVLDSINGAGCVGTGLLLKKLGCELVHFNGEPTGQFAHEPEPVAANLDGLCEAVRRHHADIGFAQDPDADRLVVVDENGRFIGEEYTLALSSAFVLRRRKGPLATNLSTSRMMDDLAASAGVQLYRTPVGEANVADVMVREGCIFGGEGNGGVMDPRVVLVRDSFVGIALVLNYLAETGKKVTELIAELPRYHMLKDKFPCPQADAVKILSAVREALASRPGATVNDEDGLRVDLPDGWVHVRASNTEPIMRIIAEAGDAEAAGKIVENVRKIAEKAL
ncbi:MAG: phosphoglucosamine mutase [Planctomycetota bacterium]|nr:phosphoglucosamine mutase [Planctomycetota bacterium]